LALVVKIKLESSGNARSVRYFVATPQLSAGIDGMEGTKRLTHPTSFKQPEAI